MIKSVFFQLFIGLSLLFMALAALHAAPQFAGDREAIIRALTLPDQGEVGDAKLGQRRSLFSSQTPRALRRQQRVEAVSENRLGVQESIEYATTAEAGHANLMLQFDFDSDKLSDSSLPLLEELAAALHDSRLQGEPLLIAGHTDAVGEDEYNMDLSIRRARSVREYLRRHFAMGGEQLRIIGFGERLPLVENDSEANRSMNRRVEVIRLASETK
ncbi:MAG: OmpA family protein [Gammaproteobacteria bacterium]|nr:OmpA family protein [Gammaproteobacteria bacterium]